MYHKAVFESSLPKFRDDYKNCQKVFTLCEKAQFLAIVLFP